MANPFHPDNDLLSIELSQGAVCTSTTLKRRWQKDGVWAHHLIDPRTGEPAESDVVSATVVAPSAARAETITKTAIILGSKAGMQFIREQGDVQGLLVLSNGGYICSAGFKAVAHAA